MFTLEINGKPIALTNADQEQARELFDDEEFKTDLRSMMSNGLPLWDGLAAFLIRPSTDEEAEAFEHAVIEEERDEDDENGVDVLFLVPVDDRDVRANGNAA
jgi:hypothetical protein